MESLCGPVFFSFARFKRHDPLSGNSSAFVCFSVRLARQCRLHTNDPALQWSLNVAMYPAVLAQRQYFGVRIDPKSVKNSATFPIHLSAQLWKWTNKNFGLDCCCSLTELQVQVEGA